MKSIIVLMAIAVVFQSCTPITRYKVGKKSFKSSEEAQQAYQEQLRKIERTVSARHYETLPKTLMVIIPDPNYILNNFIQVTQGGEKRLLNEEEKRNMKPISKNFHVTIMRNKTESLARIIRNSNMFRNTIIFDASHGTNDIPLGADTLRKGILLRVRWKGTEVSLASSGQWFQVRVPTGFNDEQAAIRAFLDELYARSRALIASSTTVVVQSRLRESTKKSRFEMIPDPASKGRSVSGQNCYRFSDNESVNQARQIALLNAKRNAAESAYTYVFSFSEVRNFQISLDEVINTTISYLTDIEITEKREDFNARTICYTITAFAKPVKMVKTEAP